MIFIVLCGGSGTRLWPISRSKYPKQLHSLIHSTTLLQDTILRVKNMESFNQEPSFFYIVTNESILQLVQENIDAIQLSKDQYKIIVEPIGRNSGPAIFMSSFFTQMENENPNEFIVVMSSDHVWNEEDFCECIQKKNIEKFENRILTLGIHPSFPHTGYGYMKRKSDDPLYSIEEFKEKPNLETAMEYVKSGNYLWNSGTFIFQYKTLIESVQRYQPQWIEIAQQNLQTFKKVDERIYFLNQETFSLFPNIAFDIAIMEKIENGSVITYHSTWSDIGSFDAIYDIKEKDQNGNILQGEEIYLHDTKNCYVYNQEVNSAMAVVGMDNVVIVNTGDAMLVMNKDRCQDIKKIIEKFEKGSPFL